MRPTSRSSRPVFYRLGIWDDEPDNQKAAAWDELDEMVRTTGSTFLGLTLGCARCHNHMFDPISQEDYYHFAAFFRNVEPYGVSLSPPTWGQRRRDLYAPGIAAGICGLAGAGNQNFHDNCARPRAKLKVLRKAEAARQRTGRNAASPPTHASIEAELSPAERAEKARLAAELVRLEKALRAVPFPRALSVRECGLPLKETRVLIRGNVATPGKRGGPRMPAVLAAGRSRQLPFHSIALTWVRFGPAPSGRVGREADARIGAGSWPSGSPNNANPLAPRVMMNRLWQEHFGRGIVRSSDNFGRAGTPPTHPNS